MRETHGGQPDRAVGGRREPRYSQRMKTPHLSRALRYSALAVLLAGLALWFSSGARLGWTQTSVVSLQRDEITGIEYPVRRDAFVAGVEVPLVAFGAAGALAAAGWFTARRRSPIHN